MFGALNSLGMLIWTIGRKAAPTAFKSAMAAAVGVMLWLSDGLWALVGTIYEELPTTTQTSLAPFLAYLGLANLLAPIKEMIVLLVAFYTVWILFVSIRFLVRSIPTMG